MIPICRVNEFEDKHTKGSCVCISAQLLGGQKL